MNITSHMEEKSRINAEVKRAEDMDSSARALVRVVEIQDDCRVGGTKFQKVQSVCVGNAPDETAREGAVAQNEGIVEAEKRLNIQNKQIEQVEEPWIENTTTEVSKSALARDGNEALAQSQFIKTHDQFNPSASYTNQSDEETLEEMELPGTSKSHQDPQIPIPSTDVEMTSTRREDLSSSSETVLELESGDVQSCLFTVPMEEKGIALFLDSCQEALALDFEVIRLNGTDMDRVEHQEETRPARDDTIHNRMRLRKKSGQECSVS